MSHTFLYFCVITSCFSIITFYYVERKILKFRKIYDLLVDSRKVNWKPFKTKYFDYTYVNEITQWRLWYLAIDDQVSTIVICLLPFVNITIILLYLGSQLVELFSSNNIRYFISIWRVKIKETIEKDILREELNLLEKAHNISIEANKLWNEITKLRSRKTT